MPISNMFPMIGKALGPGGRGREVRRRTLDLKTTWMNIAAHVKKSTNRKVSRMASIKQKSEEVIITAVYKVNLHCQQCALDIKKPLLSLQGVHNVDADFEKSEIKVKGVIDVIKIHKKIEKMSKKKVVLVSPIVKKEVLATEKKVVKEIKQVVRSTTVKVHMHCDKCENDLKTRLLKHKGIYSVKTDMKTQNLTVEGTIESDKLLAYIHKKVHKKAEIIVSKTNKKEEKKEPKKPEVKSIVKVTETKEIKTVEKVEGNNAPYFIHYVYAPQLFSDENPNACSIM